MTRKEEIQIELFEKIYKKLVHTMMGPNGEPLGGGSTDFINGLIMAYRIVESFDPGHKSRFGEDIEKMEKSAK